MNLKKIVLLSFMIIGLFSCENEDYLIFTAVPPAEGISFENALESNYLVSNQIGNNVAERFVWNAPDFGVPSTTTYILEGSVDRGFSAVDFSTGETSVNNYALKVSNIMVMAELLGLDNDPSTTNTDGTPNNIGTAYFRVSAYSGAVSDGANAVSVMSEMITLNFEVLEETAACTDAEISGWGLVGDAVNNWGGDNQGYAAGNDVAMLTGGTEGTFVTAVTFLEGQFKFRFENDWGVNLGPKDGVLQNNGDNIAITAGNYIVYLDTNNASYSLEEVADIWGVVGSATFNGWGEGPDLKMVPDPCNDGVYLAYGVALVEGEMKFRANDDWGINLGPKDGVLEQNGDNIPVTEAGTYNIMLDTNNAAYTLTKL